MTDKFINDKKKHTKLRDNSSLFSECSIASPGSPCSNLEGKDCPYKAIAADHCCCGHCPGSFSIIKLIEDKTFCHFPGPTWLNLTCVLDPTTGASLWQQKDSLCPVEPCGSKGEWWRLDFPEGSSPQVLLPHQTTLPAIQRMSKWLRQYKWKKGWSSHYTFLHLTSSTTPSAVHTVFAISWQ